MHVSVHTRRRGLAAVAVCALTAGAVVAGATAPAYAASSATGSSAESVIVVLARTLGFDRTVTSSTGDFWNIVTDPTADTGTAATIAPGATGVVRVAISPTAKAGTVVRGVLDVYTPPAFLAAFNTTGDVLAQVPYSYTVGAPATP